MIFAGVLLTQWIIVTNAGPRPDSLQPERFVMLKRFSARFLRPSTSSNNATMITDTKHALVFAFANGSGGGNPSYVLATELGHGIVADACMAIAAARGYEVTHIEFGALAGEATVRFYSPSGPIAFCGHGSLAAAAWAAAAGRAEQRLTLHYGAGSIDMYVREGGREIGYLERAGKVSSLDVDARRLALLQDALGLCVLNEQQVKLSVGGATRTKALIELAVPELLSGVNLCASAADLLCEHLGVTGLYPFFVVDQTTIRARHFPKHCSGIEDMATGNIAPTIAQHLIPRANRCLLIEQGGSACNVSRLMLTPSGQAWQVSGMCRIADA